VTEIDTNRSEFGGRGNCVRKTRSA